MKAAKMAILEWRSEGLKENRIVHGLTSSLEAFREGSFQLSMAIFWPRRGGGGLELCREADKGRRRFTKRR